MMRRALAFVLAVALGYVLAAVAATQFVLAQIIGLGLPVSLATRLRTTGQDIMGMVDLYLPILTVGLLIAFLLARLVQRWLPSHRTTLYTVAGASAILAANLAMNAVFDITPIAGARTIWGLAAQGIAGAAAGYAYAIFSLPHPRHQDA